MLLCGIEKLRLVMCGSQAFSELLECWRESVVCFVPGSPERVAAGIFWELGDLQNSIIGWDPFE
jgi:hypothetical protein